MARLGAYSVLPLLLIAVGCTDSRETTSPLVSSSPFKETGPSPVQQVSYAPAPVEFAARVNTLGRRIVAANPQAGVKSVVFFTIGAAEPEIFHRGDLTVYITSGLVEQCKTDNDLIAVLCHELAKVVAEREAVAAALPEREPPQDVPVGGPFSTPDHTHLAELAPYDAQRRRAMRGTPLPPPDPEKLARVYLRNAGLPESQLDQVEPLLSAAAANSTYQKQMNPPPAGRLWTP